MNRIKFFLLAVLLPSCSSFLDIKPDRKMVIPEKIQDFQALLDNVLIMNHGTGHLLGEISGDNYFISESVWMGLSNPYERNAHIWSKEIFQGGLSTDWNNPSLVVFYSNITLEGMKKLGYKNGENASADNINGSALFFRAYAQYQLAQLFCKTYVKSTASHDLGIPLRLESDVTMKTTRATVEECYDQITKDLKESANLLPISPLVKTRPSKAAAYALLARIYLQMNEYSEALLYGERALDLYSTLTDYNQADSSAAYPFQIYNEEVIFHSNMVSPPILNPSRLAVSSDLYNLYDNNDLRKFLYFRQDGQVYRYKGSYHGSNAFFSGVTTSEVILIIAECHARLGNHSEAITSLNHLLDFRYKKTYKLRIETEGLLSVILEERRKELPFRGLRWSDLKRLNLEKTTETVLSRNWGVNIHILSPGSPRYLFPIPEAVIELTGIEQNVR